MKIKGTLIYDGLPITIDEITMDQLIFQHKDGKTQLRITTLIDGKPMTFDELSIQDLTIVQITNVDKILVEAD